MATTMEQRAKFRELRTSGVSREDAQTQAYGIAPVAPTPVTPAPIAPAPTPVAPTVNVREQMLGKTLEEKQAIRSGTPAPVEPVTPTQIVPVATTPAPVTPTPVTPAQTPFQQAQAESEKIKAQNEAQMKLNTQQADLKAQERQQVAQETAKANTPINQKDVLNALVSGVSVAPQNTAAYRNAQMQYKTYQKFATMTPTQLADNMKMGEIGTETAQLLASNPNYIKAKEDFDKFQKNQSINNMIKSVAEGATGKTTEVDHYQNASDAIAKKLGINETNADAFARIVSQDPETLQLTKTVSNIAKQLNTLNTERNAVYEDLKKQYPDLSASAIMTLMAGRTKEATAQIDALNSSLTLTQADLKMAMEMAKAEYDATKEDITLQAGLAKEDRAMQQALALSQAQFDQKLAQQAQLTNDPTTAIGGVIKQFSDLGIVGDRDLAWHVAEQKRLGMTLPEYTKKMIEDFKAKPEYQQALAKKANEGVSFQTIGDKVYKVQNGQLVDTGISATKTPEAKSPEWKQDASGNWYNANSATSPAVQASTLSPTSIAQYSTRLKGNNVQCGMVTNDYSKVKFPDAPRMGDSYESKIATINAIGQAPIPQVGGLFVMDTGTSTGHTGIVTAVNGDGTFTATDANKSGSKDGGPLQTSTYKISDKVSFSNAPTGGQVTTSSDAQNWFNLIQKGTTSYEDVMKKLGGTKVGQAVLQEINGLISSQGGAIPALPDSPQVKQMDTLLDTVKGLVNDPDAIENLSGFFQTSPWDAMTGKNDDTRSAIEFLVKGQTLQQLIDAKAQGATFGALSNEELKMLQNSANRLTSMIEFDETGKVKNFKGKEETVKAELKKLLDTFTEKRNKMVNPGLNKNTIPNQSIPASTPTNTGGGQTQNYKGYTITGL